MKHLLEHKLSSKKPSDLISTYIKLFKLQESENAQINFEMVVLGVSNGGNTEVLPN